MLSKKVDYATHGFPVATEKEFANKEIRVLRPPVYSGPALFLNLDKLTEFKDVRARQALAHAINRDQNGTVSLAESGKGVKFMSGFSDLQVPDWLSEEEQGELNQYEFDQDKAASLLTAGRLEEAGRQLAQARRQGRELRADLPGRVRRLVGIRCRGGQAAVTSSASR